MNFNISCQWLDFWLSSLSSLWGFQEHQHPGATTACDCGWNNISPSSSSTEEGNMQCTNLDTCLPPELSSNKKSSLFSLSQLIWKFLGFITISTCNYHRFPPKNSQPGQCHWNSAAKRLPFASASHFRTAWGVLDSPSSFGAERVACGSMVCRGNRGDNGYDHQTRS